jgi:hypothetical protein
MGHWALGRGEKPSATQLLVPIPPMFPHLLHSPFPIPYD